MNRACSIFSQILQSLPRLEFEATIKKSRGKHRARGFEYWTRFVAMLSCQLGDARSLSKITGGLVAARLEK